MVKKQFIANAIKQANILESVNPITKGLLNATAFSGKHPHITAALLGALAVKFGPDVARRIVYESQNTIQGLTNPYYGGGYGNNYY